MAAQNLALDSFWIDRSKYSEAEKHFYERLGHEALTPLAAEVAKARERIREMKRQVDEGATVVGDGCINVGLPVEHETKTILGEPNKEVEIAAKQKSPPPKEQSVPASTNDKLAQDLPQEVKQVIAPECKESANMDFVQEQEACPVQTPVKLQEEPALICKKSTPIVPCNMPSLDNDAIKFLEKKMMSFHDVLAKVQDQLEAMDARLSSIEKTMSNIPKSCPIAICPAKPSAACSKPPPAEPAPKKADDDDDVDLFGSESEDDETSNKLKEARVAAYNAKKSKKPALIAKSSIILDVKPWDDETDMKLLEDVVRKIECDGLLWGASKLVPLAYGIRKLQINCVVEDDKVSIDWLQEQIEANEDYVQSVDIAAFNKI